MEDWRDDKKQQLEIIFCLRQRLPRVFIDSIADGIYLPGDPMLEFIRAFSAAVLVS